jgi:SAM-dependent methyltransferase
MSHNFLKKKFFPKKNAEPDSEDTSWNSHATWYQNLVGQKGHYYHRQLILPGVLRLLDLQEKDRVIDFGCGQGIFAAAMPKVAAYLGIDLAPQLLHFARQNIHRQECQFRLFDLCQIIKQAEASWTKGVMILSLQNMREPAIALQNAAAFLQKDAELIIVLNHPCFRIPRQSFWAVDNKSKQQYRGIYRYLSPLEVPIEMHPSQGKTELSWTFHHSLQDFSQMLFEQGFLIEQIEEWASDKESQGKAAKMENRSRAEIPLFLTLKVKKVR